MAMKLNVNLVQTLLALALGANAQIIIPNADFESWTIVAGNNPDIPAGWKDYGGLFPGIHKESGGHSGSSALRVSVAHYFTGAGAGDIKGGFSLPTIPTAPLYFGFWAKVHIVGTDHLNVTADLTKAPSNTITTTIPYGKNYLASTDNTTTWTWFSFGLQTSDPIATDSASIRFTFSPALDTGSNVIIDDIAFTNSKSAGIRDVSGNPNLQTSSPLVADAFENLIYGLEAHANVSIVVYDLLGHHMTTVSQGRQEMGMYKAEIDVRSFVDGVYHARLSVGAKEFTRTFILRHS